MITAYCPGIIANKETVVKSKEELEHIVPWIWNRNVSLCTGYFAPLHSGHIEYIEEASRYGDFCIVAVNNNESLLDKKGLVAIDEEERLRVISSIRYVDMAIVFDGETSELIRLLKPKYFCNGGDRSTMESQNQEEIKACEEIGCKLMLGVGGSNKRISSSKIIESFVNGWKNGV